MSTDRKLDSLDPATLRTVLGHYPSGVTIVTCVIDGAPTGFTCQSFHSLSLDPPMVVLLAGRNSKTWPKIRDAGKFCVNILSEDQRDLCRQFAVSDSDKFSGVSWHPSPNGSPVIDAVSGWVECELDSEFDGGDHLIVTARVTNLSAEESAYPLVFHRGIFRSIAADPI